MKRLLGVTFCLCMAVLLSGFACNESDYRKANRAAKQIADDIQEFQIAVKDQCNEINGSCTGELGNAEAVALSKWAIDATKISDELVAQIKLANQAQGTENQRSVQLLNDLSVAVNKLQTDGLLRIKSEKAKKQFDVLYKGLQSAIATLQVLVSHNSPGPLLPQRPLLAELDASLVMTIFLAALRLVAKFKADGKLTDEEIQAATLAENEETRRMATELINKLSGPQT